MASEILILAPAVCGIDGPYKVLKIFVTEGSQVSFGDIVLELECDEAFVKIESFDHGKVSLHVEVGEIVQSNQPLATVTEMRAS